MYLLSNKEGGIKVDTKVFVIGCTGIALMPTTPRKARVLLKAGKAEVFCKRPFTIKLLYKTGSTTQPLALGIDTGSQHIGIGLCIVEDDKASEALCQYQQHASA